MGRDMGAAVAGGGGCRETGRREANGDGGTWGAVTQARAAESRSLPERHTRLRAGTWPHAAGRQPQRTRLRRIQSLCTMGTEPASKLVPQTRASAGGGREIQRIRVAMTPRAARESRQGQLLQVPNPRAARRGRGPLSPAVWQAVGLDLDAGRPRWYSSARKAQMAGALSPYRTQK